MPDAPRARRPSTRTAASPRRRRLLPGFLDGRHVIEGSAADVFIAWQYPLHRERRRLAGRLLVFAGGVAVVALA